MKFYKFVLRAKSSGNVNERELVIYISAENYSQAMKQAKAFPAVKYERPNVIISSNVVDEIEYVHGIIVSGYSGRNDIDGYYLNQFEHIVKILSYLKGYRFESADGKILKNFVTRYNKASNEEKPAIEQEYYNWAQSLVDSNQLVR